MNQASTNFEEAVTNNTEPVKVQPAGFFIRLAAYLVDYLIAGGIIAMIKVPLWFVKLLVPDSIVFKNILFGYDIFDIANFCLLSAYFIIMTYTCGRTVGKMLMKIKVVPVKSKEFLENEEKEKSTVIRSSVYRIYSGRNR